MGNRSSLRSATLKAASAVSSVLLSTAALAGGASAQSLPSTDALPSGGAGVTIGPEGIKAGVESGPTGGVTVGAGPGGLDVNLGGSAAPPAGGNQPGERVSTPGAPRSSAPSAGGSSPSAPAARDDAPGGSAPASGGRGAGEPRRTAGAAERLGDTGGDSGDEAGLVGGLRPAARAEREDRGGVAPVFDLVERIPSAVRAGLVALALIAIAMWALWVQGRRRLDKNAYMDPATGVGNMAAFEELLEREWQRAARYRRPLGLLLLDLELRGPTGTRLLGERDARGVVGDLSQEVRESDIVARLAPARFAVICPEAPQGSVETLAHAVELRLEERRLRCWAGFAERSESDGRPADLVARAAAALADMHGQATEEVEQEAAAGHPAAFPPGRVAA